MVKIKCKICSQILEIPTGSCPICFSDVLDDILEEKDEDKRFGNLTDFINILTNFDYERGVHNTKCKNDLDIDGILGLDWEEV